MSIISELKRRNVFRVGIAYLIGSWLVLQVVDVIAPILDLPNWISRAILLLLAVGFLIALILAWAYELTPEGIKREEDVDRSESITPKTGRKLDFIIIGVLSVAVVFFALDKFVWTASEVSTAAAVDEQQTIAVLPFVNMSSDEEQEYFSDGLTEELLNLLARIPQLRVTSRTSAFYYKDKDFTIEEVGAELGVAHVLEGSVRRSGDTLRITAQLIDVSSDAHLWSETWDRQLVDVFAIQDEIAQAVVDELRIRLVGQTPRVRDTDPEAYSLYLRARHLTIDRSVANYEKAQELLQQAIAIDPDFVSALLTSANIYLDGRGLGMYTTEDAKRLSRTAVDHALELEPDNGRVYSALSFAAQNLYADIASAIQASEKALVLSPNDIDVIRDAAFLAARTGDFEKARLLNDRAKSLDPVAVENWYGIGLGEMAAGRFDEAEDAFRRAIELAPEGVGNNQRLAWAMLLKGDLNGALEAAAREPIEPRRASVRALIYMTMGDVDKAVEEHEILESFGERWTYEIARMYAYRDMHDEAFHWIERAFARGDSSLWFVSWDPFLDNIRDDPRFRTVEERLLIRRD